VRVDDSRDARVIDVPPEAGELLGDGDALLLSLVRKHLATDLVAKKNIKLGLTVNPNPRCAVFSTRVLYKYPPPQPCAQASGQGPGKKRDRKLTVKHH